MMKKQLLFATAMLLCAGSMMAQPKSASEPELFIKSSQSLMAPVWSPDGSKIAVTGDNYIGIWVANADGSGLQQVSEALGAGYKMAWTSANAIQSTPYEMKDQRRMTRIESIDATTGKATVVAQAQRGMQPSKAMRRTTSALQVMVDDPAGATQRISSLNQFAGKMVLNPTLSPDGKKIAFQIVSNGVWVCDADGSNPVSLGAGAYPAWLPDSKNVVVTRLTDNGHSFTGGDLWCVTVANGQAMCLTPGTDMIPVTLAVSPDGTKVAFDNDADGCIYLINLKY